MAIPIDQDGRVEMDSEEKFWRNLDTRIAGGQRIPSAESNQVCPCFYFFGNICIFTHY